MPGSAGRWLALAALSLTVLVVGLDTTVLNVALPTISTALGADTAALQWVVDAYLIAVVAAMLPAGLLGDRYGRKRVLLAGLVVFGAASVCSALSGSPGELVAARALQGVGAAVLVPLSLAITATTFAPTERAKAIGILTAAVAGGLPLGPILGGVLLARLSWASVFWINVPIVAVAVVASYCLLGDDKGSPRVQVDWIGTLTSAAGLVALVYAVVHAPTSGWTARSTLVLAAAAVVLLAGFVWHQRWTAHPLVDVTLFASARFSWGSVAAAGASAVLLAVLFVVPQYLQGVRAASPLATGLGVLPLMGGLLLAGAASSRAQQRLGTKTVVAGAFVVLAAGAGTLAAVDPTTSYPLLGTGLLIAGAGVGAAVAPAMDAATGAVPASAAGAGSALVNTLRQLGGALAVAALGSLLSWVYAHHLTAATAALPADDRARALGSIAGAMATAASSTGGPSAASLHHAAGIAFSDGMTSVMLTCAGLALVCAALTLTFLPAEPDHLVTAGADSTDPTQPGQPDHPGQPGDEVTAVLGS